MRQLSLLILLSLFAAVGCTRPPYSSPGKELAAVEADYTDCFTEASLSVNTPPFPDSPLGEAASETDSCMRDRGYAYHMRLF